MDTYTLYLPDGPVEIQARDITEASAYARHQLQARGVYGPAFRLVNDRTGKTNHVQRIKDKPHVHWVPGPDAPLRGPFNYGLGS